jgi:hypothetical protein
MNIDKLQIEYVHVYLGVHCNFMNPNSKRTVKPVSSGQQSTEQTLI